MAEINFIETSRLIKVNGNCETENLRLDVSYEKEGQSGNPRSINGQVYNKEDNSYVGHFNVDYRDGKPSHSFNVGDDLTVVAELIDAIGQIEDLISESSAE